MTTTSRRSMSLAFLARWEVLLV
ncbi:MAG: hypothetical protein JWO59_1346, partial [Chloroflexi bacterium]|nr:hypothetical protein [Chloroflexota bacterium]